MAGHIERKEVIYMLVLVGFIVGVITFYNRQYFLNDAFRNMDHVRKSPVVAPKGNSNQANQTYQKKIEASLNQMLANVYTEMQEYRVRRKILHDITRPKNLQNANYITESYKLANQTIPDLKSRSDKIIAIFSNKDAEIKNLIKNRPQEAQNNILTAWNKMKREQVDLYVKYFGIEQTILDKYQTLINLYYANKNQVVYLTETDQAIFNSPEKNAQAAKLSNEIKALKKQQAALSK